MDQLDRVDRAPVRADVGFLLRVMGHLQQARALLCAVGRLRGGPVSELSSDELVAEANLCASRAADIAAEQAARAIALVQL